MALDSISKSKLNYYELDTPYVAISEDYAAVSILIFEKEEILYIKRSNEMPTHKGHIAFPGGKKEDDDKNIQQQKIASIPPVPMKSWWVTVAHARCLQIYSWADGRAAQEGVFGTKS